MIGYNEKVFRQIAKDRGYETKKATMLLVAKILGISPWSAQNRLVGKVQFTFAESFVVASYFEMTPKEYVQVFLDGLFQERHGRFVAHVDDPVKVLKEQTMWSKKRAEKRAEKQESGE